MPATSAFPSALAVLRTTVREARRELEREGEIEVVPAAERERRTQLGQAQDDWQWSELPPRPEIMAHGLCVVGGYDPDHWHRPRWDHAGRAEAIAICHQCPALADCAEWSLSLPATEKYAIYGAMSAIERARRRRERKHEAQTAIAAGQ